MFHITRAPADAAQQSTQANTRTSKWKEFFQEPLPEKIAMWRGEWKTCRRRMVKKIKIAREYGGVPKDYRGRAEELLPEKLKTKENVVMLARFLATNHDYGADYARLNEEMKTFFENYAHKWNAVKALVFLGEIAIKRYGTMIHMFKCFNLLAQNGFKDTNVERIANALFNLLDRKTTPRELYNKIARLITEGTIRSIGDLERLSVVEG